MSEIPDRNNLFDEIEERQDDLLRQLDELNNRVVSVLKEHGGGASLTDVASDPSVVNL